MGNPRRSNGYRRDKLRAYVKAQEQPCAICGHPIDYSLSTYRDPKDGKIKRHPLSFELDEIVPVSFGGSPFDLNNVQAVHRICNQKRGNKPMKAVKKKRIKQIKHSRNW